jgi:hypothetical protein
LAEEMEEVIETLKNEQASEEIIRRQERILSRLLDAQRSVKRRDYSRRRQARSGQDVFRQSPGGEAAEDFKVLERLRRDILRIGEEGYARDYQALIRRYFEALIASYKEQARQ